MGRYPHVSPLTLEQNALATQNAGLVWYAMKTLRVGGTLNPDDRLSACGMALVYAARTFDPKKGLFAPHYMRWAQSILQTDARKSGIILIPHRLTKTVVLTKVSIENIGNIGLEIHRSLKYEDAEDLFWTLPPRQRELMHMIHDLGMSTRTIAEKWNVTRSAIHAVYKRAIQRLRKEAERRKNL